MVIKTTAKSNLFFLELIVMLLILTLSLAVCTQVFFYAQITAEHSRDLSNAIARAQSAAACYKAADGNLAQTAEYLSSSHEAGALSVYYDNKWQPAAVGQGTYQLRISEENRVAEITVTRLADRSEIFSLRVKAVFHE
jgi:hypothetical protein